MFEKFLQASFKKIEQSNISRLIIDVRGNLGGDLDLATGLLSYVATEPVAIIARTELRVSQQAKADFALKIPTALRWLPVQYLDSKGREVWGAAEGSLVSFSEKPGNKKQGAASAAGLRFTGKVIVLVDAISTSAAEYFADAVQRNKLGTVIGQAAGNAPNIWYGEPLLVKMPHTELGFTVSRMAFYPPAIESISTPGHLVPDFSVARNLADELARQDTILSFALKQP